MMDWQTFRQRLGPPTIPKLPQMAVFHVRRSKKNSTHKSKQVQARADHAENTIFSKSHRPPHPGLFDRRIKQRLGRTVIGMIYPICQQTDSLIAGSQKQYDRASLSQSTTRICYHNLLLYVRTSEMELLRRMRRGN